MKILKQLGSLALIALLLAGCTSAKPKDETPSTISVTDAKGNVVTIEKAEKAVIFDYGVLDIMMTIGVEVEVGLPSGSLPTYLNQYNDAPTMGSIKEPDMEAIFDFAPDVIFISGRQESFYDQLNEIVPTIYLDVTSTQLMADTKRNAEVVGTIFGKESSIASELAIIEEKIAAVKELTKNNDSTGLIVLTNDGSVSAYGAGSRFGLIHDVLDVKQADANIVSSTHGQEANFEYISSVNPDLLFVVDRTSVVGGSNDASSTLDNALVNETKAAKNGKIIMLNPETWYLSSGGLTSLKSMIEEIRIAVAE